MNVKSKVCYLVVTNLYNHSKSIRATRDCGRAYDMLKNIDSVVEFFDAVG